MDYLTEVYVVVSLVLSVLSAIVLVTAAWIAIARQGSKVSVVEPAAPEQSTPTPRLSEPVSQKPVQNLTASFELEKKQSQPQSGPSDKEGENTAMFDKKALANLRAKAEEKYRSIVVDVTKSVQDVVGQLPTPEQQNQQQSNRVSAGFYAVTGNEGTNQAPQPKQETPLPLQPEPLHEDQPADQPEEPQVYRSAVVMGTSKESGRLIPLSQASRRQGTYMVGVNGTGKSTLIANLIVQDIEQGLGVCLLDPHGDVTADVLSRIPEARIEDVILLDLMDSEYPFGLNLFECPNNQDVKEVAKTAGFVMHVFEKVWGVGTETPQLAQVLRNVSVTLIANPGITFNEIPLLLQDEAMRGKLTANVTNNQVKLFWQTYNRLRPVDQFERTSSTLNKVDAFLTQPIIANIVGQSQTTIDFREIMDSGKILLVQLNPQLEDISALVGSVIIGQLLNTALSRKDIPEVERKQFNLYADEYQRFATEDFATLLSEARKFGIATTIAHQTRSQLDLANKGASLNAANKIIFRVTGEDGKELAREFDHTPTRVQIGEEPVRAPVADTIRHLLEKGHANPQAGMANGLFFGLLEYAGSKINRPRQNESDDSWVGVAMAGMFDRHDAKKYREALARVEEANMVIHELNEYLYMVQVRRVRTEPIPSSLLTLLAHKQILNFERLTRSPQILGILCDVRFADRGFPLADLQAYGLRVSEYEYQTVVNILQPLHLVIDVLAKEPILVDTGQYKPKYQQRTYADMEGEIASTLTNLPNFEARIKTVKGETTMLTLPLTQGIGGYEFDERRNLVQAQTRQAYCKPVAEVEQEIADRQAALMEEEEPLQGHKEEVAVERQTQWQPSRRHKIPPSASSA